MPKSGKCPIFSINILDDSKELRVGTIWKNPGEIDCVADELQQVRVNMGQ